jgi:putative nucleotidyltransferase with HDIG domain
MQEIASILDRVEILPVSPSLLPKLLPQLSDVNGNFDEVVRIISLEQTLTAKLLQICNSAFFGQDEPVTTVAEAVNRVGYQSIYLLAAVINGSNSFPVSSPGGLDTCKLWKHSVASAFYAKYCAESAGLDANAVFTAALMHDIGKVVLAQIGSGKNPGAYHKPATPDSLVAEKMDFGCDHAEVGALLLEKWKLPLQLIYSIRHHHQPSEAGRYENSAACVAIGNALTHEPLYPNAVKEPVFTASLTLLQLNAEHQKRWRRQFDDASELISGMSRLPL